MPPPHKGETMAKKKSKQGKTGLTIVGVLLLLLVGGGLFLADSLGIIDVNWEQLAEEMPADLEEVITDLDQDTTQDEPPAEPVTGAWYQLYFSSPQFPDEPETRINTIEQALVGVIDSAQSTLDIAIYELDLEPIGEAILAARDRGVTVRMVTDSDTLEDDEVMISLDEAGLDIVEDERSAIMHHKFVVVDGAGVWNGSWNFTPNGTFRNNNNAIYIESAQLAENFTTEFEEMFVGGEFGPRSPVNTPYPQVRVGDTLIETCFSPEDECLIVLNNLINGAERSIRFMAFSFTLDEIGQAIVAKAATGVEVQGVFENRGSNTEYSEFGLLSEAGLDVLQDGNPYTLHHKVFIIDDEIVLTGSFNFSVNASESNEENIMIIHNADIAREYLGELERVYEQALNPPS